jgi:hypothetical protein
MRRPPLISFLTRIKKSEMWCSCNLSGRDLRIKSAGDDDDTVVAANSSAGEPDKLRLKTEA